MKSHLLGLNEIFLQLPNAWLGHKFYLFSTHFPQSPPQYSSKLQFQLASSLAQKHCLARVIDLKLFSIAAKLPFQFRHRSIDTF